PAQSFAGAVEPFALPAPLLAALRELSLREGATLFMTLLAGFAAVLHRASGQEDIVIGSPVAGRNRRETEELIGCFVNILPLRIDLAGRPSYRELLRRVRAVALAAYDHQDAPFERLVEALQPRRDLSRPALRQVAFSVQETSRKAIELGEGITARALAVEAGVARLDLTLFAWAGEEGLAGFCEFSTALFDRATIARLLEQLRATLTDMVAGVERPLLAPPRQSTTAPPMPPMPASPTPDDELTESQLLFWFARKLQPDVELYFERATATFAVAGELDPVHFERAFAALVELCDALRTRVREVSGIPKRSLAMAATPLEVFDFALAEAPEDAFRQWLKGRSERPMNPAERLYDTALARLGAGRWVWYLSLHHMIADGWSLSLLAGRLSELYRLSLAGRLGEAQPYPSFAEYAREERARRGTERYSRAKLYWEQKLARPAPPNPFYRRAGAGTSLETKRLSLELSREQSAEIAAAAAARGAFSSSVVFASALFALLYRLSGERRLRLGTPFANRPDHDRGVVGLLMNACPLEVEIAEGETFASFARKLQREIVAASRHQHYPVRHPAEGRAYDVYFNFQSISFPELCGLPVEFELLHSGFSLDAFHLQVSDFAGGERFRLDFDFQEDAFAGEERERTVGHYLALLAAATATPATTAGDLRLAEAPMLSPAERQEVLVGFNATAVSYPHGLTLDRLLAAESERSPGEIAVAAEGGTLTYRELGRRSDQMARFLRARGVGPDTLVGVAMERSLELMVALVGILKAGGAYVPLDPAYPAYPADRLAGMVADAQVPLLLTQAHLAGSLRALGTPLFCLDSEWEEVARLPAEGLPPLATEESLAYVIFTSGSTGRPKGAMLSHAGIVNRLLWMQDAYGLMPADRVLQKTPVSFDVSVWELFWPMMTGAALVVAVPGGHQDPVYLARAIAAERITTLHFVPSMLQAFLAQPELSACRSLRQVI
ncbi:MAG TPA: condensation domain-containing protein, partial [Thermoanaerobaculia bacterium]|nr:condensation domain-containing protein [Thermoanaerobaculia bacterium]